MKIKKMYVLLIISCFILNIFLISSPISKAQKIKNYEFYVGGSGIGNYSKIQNAINSSSSGDSIYIYPGTYQENIIVNKSITINASNNTILKGKNLEVGLFISSNNVTIKNLIINNYTIGISLFANNCIIKSNIIINNSFNGIYSYTLNYTGPAVNKNIIKENSIKNNGDVGIYLAGVTDNLIYKNIIKNNKNYNIYLHFSDNNKIFYNNFFQNKENVFDNSNNTWYNQSTKIGNYWDDYSGKDKNNDGIGDTAYIIKNGKNKDKYPLMSPYPNYQLNLKEEFNIDEFLVYRTIVISLIIAIIFCLPIAYFWRKKYLSK